MKTLPALNFPNAQAALAVVTPDLYAKTRNHLQGAVSRLSPFVTHGLLDTTDLYSQGCVQAGRPLHPSSDKWVMELGWREFFQQVLAHCAWGVVEPLRAAAPGVALGDAPLPDDIRIGRTGIPVIDQAVRTLVQTGYLHNHARMWLASYVIHLRKVAWRAGADWMLGHLYDGDVAANHLSWQWVASTFSIKPYLFNADNVSKHAPAPWHSPDSVLDVSYETLAQYAGADAPVLGSAARASQQAFPFEDDLRAEQIALFVRPPSDLLAKHGIVCLEEKAPVALALQGAEVLIHPWCLGFEPQGQAQALGLLAASYHRVWPWSKARWDYVLAGLAERCNTCVWVGPADEPPEPFAVCARTLGTLQPGYRELLHALESHRGLRVEAPRTLWERSSTCQWSYSRWAKQARFLGGDAPRV